MQLLVWFFFNVCIKLQFSLRIFICTSTKNTTKFLCSFLFPDPAKKTSEDLDLILVKVLNLLELHSNTGIVKGY